MTNQLEFSLGNWGEFGQIRYCGNLTANQQLRIPIVVPSGKTYYIFKYRFGDMTADTVYFRFSGVLNYYEQNILVGTELLTWVVEPQPYIAIKGSSGSIIFINNTAVSRDYSIVLDYIIISDEIAEDVRAEIIGRREIARGKITSSAGTGGA